MGIVNHIKRWNIWRKGSLNGLFYKLAVLFGIIKFPSFELTFEDDARFTYTNTMLIIRTNA